MNYKKIQFTDINAQRVYDNYIKRIETATKSLATEDSTEVLMEFNSHIYESIQNKGAESELEKLLNAIDNLGIPEEVLKPLIADKFLDKATKSFNPVDILRALALNITNGISYVIFFILYLSLGGFLFLIFAKLINGDNVGMFFRNGKFQVLGLTPHSEGYDEVLGIWFIPIMILSMLVLYFLITLVLKFKKSINKTKS